MYSKKNYWPTVGKTHTCTNPPHLLQHNFWNLFNRILKGGVVIPLIFPKVPQSSQTESLRVPPGPLRSLQLWRHPMRHWDSQTTKGRCDANSCHGLMIRALAPCIYGAYIYIYGSSDRPLKTIPIRSMGLAYLPTCKNSWWLNQPIWKICASNWIISPRFGVKMKPPPRKFSWFFYGKCR